MAAPGAAEPPRGAARPPTFPGHALAPARPPLGAARPPVRLPVVAVLLLCWLIGSASPAGASHDDYAAGAVVLRDRPGAADTVVVVFPEGTGEHAVHERVLRHARDAGVQVRGLRVQPNTDPDTLRAFVPGRLSDRTGFLQRRLPAQRVDAWRGLSGADGPHLSLTDWARVDGLRPEWSCCSCLDPAGG